MSLLVGFLGSAHRGDDSPKYQARATQAIHLQGFGTPKTFEWSSGQVWWFPTPGKSRGSGASTIDGNRFAAYVGTVHWKGLTGVELLKYILNNYQSPQEIPLRDFSGSFAMLFCSEQGVYLFNDALGIQKIYKTSDWSIFSTSLLVCRANLESAIANKQPAREYVLYGGTHGLETAIEGIDTVDPTAFHELRSQRAQALYPPESWRASRTQSSLSQTTEVIASMIKQDFEGMVSAFGANLGMALSGGFDSRLILAALDAVKVEPRMFVYGSDQDEDVLVAKAVAKALNFKIKSVDKDLLNASLPTFDEHGLAKNISYFDGLPNDGVFDRGADLATRVEQTEFDFVNLNGGGGEILRNFFYLPDRSYSATDVVSAFYSNWVPEVIADPEERRHFKNGMVDNIIDSLGLEGLVQNARNALLPRSDVELIYSLVRLRYWMGRNNTISARYGEFLTPLTHPRLVTYAANLPLRWKHFGDLQSKVIAKLSTRVAAVKSAYGFDFNEGPNIAYKLGIAATLMRPLGLRVRSAQIRRQLASKRIADPPREWTAAAGFSTDVDWLDARFLTNSDQINRLLTLKAVLANPFSGEMYTPSPRDYSL
jgi:hypothetical protein